MCAASTGWPGLRPPEPSCRMARRVRHNVDRFTMKIAGSGRRSDLGPAKPTRVVEQLRRSGRSLHGHI